MENVDKMDKLLRYVADFNKQDEECYKELIPNDKAYEWLKEHIPYLDCPDKEIEKVYYYRWWTYRKHIKHTSDGYVVTEFMPNVPWASTHNTLNAPLGHQIAEGRWLSDKEGVLKDYILFWLKEKGDSHSYSTWFISALWDYCAVKGDYSLGVDNLEDICRYFEKWEETHLSENGMFWSVDDRDAMEKSISGVNSDGKMLKGFRPTLNSYMTADAIAISKFARIAGKTDIEEKYAEKAENLKKLLIENLWDGEFFRACHIEDDEGNPILGEAPKEQNVRELIGYIPWMFNLPPQNKGMEKAFSHLKSREGFLSAYGLTTAEQCHKRYLYESKHGCMWNGYIWPFATSQTLNAVANVLRNYSQDVINKDDFYKMLTDYTEMHYRTTEDGKRILWIDEVMNPRNGVWSVREILKDSEWPVQGGGYERGKDYNHSTYCDIILGGLLGISVNENSKVEVNPLIPDNWEYFTVSNIELSGEKYRISYEKGKEIIIERLIQRVGKGQ